MVDVFDCDICSVFDVGGVEVFGVLFDIGMGVVQVIVELLVMGCWCQFDCLCGDVECVFVFEVVLGIGYVFVLCIYDVLYIDMLEEFECVVCNGQFEMIVGVGLWCVVGICVVFDDVLSWCCCW